MSVHEVTVNENKEFIRNRITQLRLNAGISEYQMSLDLGQNHSYIQSISSGRAMPSMSGFLNICEYFGITPVEFFSSPAVSDIKLLKNIKQKIERLSEEDLLLLDTFINRIFNSEEK